MPAEALTVILIDTGPIVALILRGDPNHQRCVEASRNVPRTPLITSWPYFTEAMYLLHRGGGYPAQAVLWKMRTSRRLVIEQPVDLDAERMAELMEQYRDVPMDLGDASLVATAERLDVRTVFTLDHHFRIYRLKDGTVLDVVP